MDWIQIAHRFLGPCPGLTSGLLYPYSTPVYCITVYDCIYRMHSVLYLSYCTIRIAIYVIRTVVIR